MNDNMKTTNDDDDDMECDGMGGTFGITRRAEDSEQGGVTHRELVLKISELSRAAGWFGTHLCGNCVARYCLYSRCLQNW